MLSVTSDGLTAALLTIYDIHYKTLTASAIQGINDMQKRKSHVARNSERTEPVRMLLPWYCRFDVRVAVVPRQADNAGMNIGLAWI